MVAGLEVISGGTVSIGNRVVNGLRPRERNIAMVFQNYALYPHMTVRENMSFGLRLAKAPEAEISARIAEAARILGLSDKLDRTPSRLSGGERQRVAMGRAMVRRPDAFLFDEPLSNLDAKLRTTMRTEIKRLHRQVETTVVYVTHGQVEAMTLADRIVSGWPRRAGGYAGQRVLASGKHLRSRLHRLASDELHRCNRCGRRHRASGWPKVAPPGGSLRAARRPPQADDRRPCRGHRARRARPGAGSVVGLLGANPILRTTRQRDIADRRTRDARGRRKMLNPIPVSPGQVIPVQLNLQRMHLFDAASGISLAATSPRTA
jgi:multiple sugar transport system ATP-binding protein